MTFEEMKNGVKPILQDTYNLSDEDVEAIIYNRDEDEFADVEQKLIGELGIPSLPSMDICCLTREGKEFTITILTISEDTGEHLALLNFGNCCTDVTRANRAMDEYDQSLWADWLTIENEVTTEEDMFTLSYTFQAKNSEELRNAMQKVFDAMENLEFIDLLENIVQYF